VEIALGMDVQYAINATGDITIRWGPAGNVPAAGNNDWRIPANTPVTLDTGRAWTSFTVYNQSASNAVDVYILPLSIT